MLQSADVPAETDLLCEACGYTLNGLPTTGKCPECGSPIADSIGSHRHLADFEVHPNLQTLVATTAAVLFRTTEFYRTLRVRERTRRDRLFGRIHLAMAIVLFMACVVGHSIFVFEVFGIDRAWLMVVLLLGTPLLLVSMLLLLKLATWLSAIEARYWGMRLPYPVVARGLAFHTAHYLPVGLLANLVIWGYRFLLSSGILDHRHDFRYLYTLSAVVLVSAGYLFRTYWIAMRNMMRANR